jgi:hypothetical protein
MRLELTDEERDELIALARVEYAELNPEIARTTDTVYREQLHRRRDLLQGLIAKLGTSAQLTA